MCGDYNFEKRIMFIVKGGVNVVICVLEGAQNSSCWKEFRDNSAVGEGSDNIIGIIRLCSK